MYFLNKPFSDSTETETKQIYVKNVKAIVKNRQER